MHISEVDLVEYLNRFKDEQRETVYKSILDSNIMEQAFDTIEGKAILNQTIDMIARNVINIVAVCIEAEPRVAIEKAYPYCLEISVAHKMLNSWAKVLTSGGAHKAKIELLKEA